MSTKEIDRPPYIEPRLPYNDSVGTVEISPRERKIGAETLALFEGDLIRQPRWYIGKGMVIIDNTDGKREIISGLDKEQISPLLARLIAGAATVENALPDYTIEGTRLARSNIGLFAYHIQWGHEELIHCPVLLDILRQTDHRTKDQTIEERLNGLEKVWQLPFPTPRQIVIHAASQEMGTSLAYGVLEGRATEEGALNTARILKLIKDDEIYHWSAYTKIARIYYEDDPQGTIEDALDVGEEFRMPGENLHTDPLQWLRDLKVIGLLNRRLIADKVVLRTLEGFGFIPKDVARETADRFYRKIPPLTLDSLRRKS